MRTTDSIETQDGECSSSEFIARQPWLQPIRSELGSWRWFNGLDRGDVHELLNMTAIALGLWYFHRCGETAQDEQILDCATRFLMAAGTFALEEELRLAGSGTLGNELLEQAQEDVICAKSAFAVMASHERAVEVFSNQYFGQTSENWSTVAEALVVDGLKALKDRRDRYVDHPVGDVLTGVTSRAGQQNWRAH